jgi:hypothetical protein
MPQPDSLIQLIRYTVNCWVYDPALSFLPASAVKTGARHRAFDVRRASPSRWAASALTRGTTSSSSVPSQAAIDAQTRGGSPECRWHLFQTPYPVVSRLARRYYHVRSHQMEVFTIAFLYKGCKYLFLAIKLRVRILHLLISNCPRLVQNASIVH